MSGETPDRRAALEAWLTVTDDETLQAEAREELLAELRAKVEALEILPAEINSALRAVLALLSPDTGAPESTQKEKE